MPASILKLFIVIYAIACKAFLDFWELALYKYCIIIVIITIIIIIITIRSIKVTKNRLTMSFTWFFRYCCPSILQFFADTFPTLEQKLHNPFFRMAVIKCLVQNLFPLYGSLFRYDWLMLNKNTI